VTGRAPRARIAGVLLLAAVLASGLAGRGLAMASVSGDGARGQETAATIRHVPAASRDLASAWRLSARAADQDADENCDVRGVVENPPEGATLPVGLLTVTGWAADMNSTDGPGISEVRVALDADPDAGGVPVTAVYGTERSDIADLLGNDRFKDTGFALAWDTSTTTPGTHVLYVQVLSKCGWVGVQRSVTVAGGTVAADASPAATPAGATPAGATAATAETVSPTPSPSPSRAAPGSDASTPPDSRPGWRWTSDGQWVNDLTGEVFRGGQIVRVGTPQVTPTPGAGAAQTPGTTSGSPGPLAFPTLTITTATPAPTATGTIPAPGSPAVAIDPFNGAVTLTWTAPAAMVRAYLVVVNESNGTQRPITDVPGSQTRAVIPGLDPRIGYSLSVIGIDSEGRRGNASSPVSTAGAPTVTPIPTPTIPPNCTPVPFAPPYCPGGYPGAPPGYPGVPPGAPGYPGFPGVGYPPGAYNPYGVPPGAYPPGVIPPGGIGGTFTVTATQSSPGVISLSWPAVPGAVSYNVWQGINGAPLVLWGPSSGTTATVTLTQPSASYVFQVHAIGAGGAEIGVSNITPAITGTGVGVIPPPVGVGAVGIPSPINSRFTAPPTASIAASPAGIPVTAQIRDANNNPVPNVTVIVNVPPGLTITPPQVISDPGGNAIFTVRPTVPGVVTINGTANGVTIQPATINVTP